MTAPTFTWSKEDLLNIQADNGQPLYYQLLAAFALALLERAEKAEAERDDAIARWARRAKEAEARLESAEEAIRQADNRTADPGDLSREGYSIDFCKRVGVWLNSPAVVRARERGK